MKRNKKRELVTGSVLLGAFAVWTAVIQLVDVRNIGIDGTRVGLAALNSWFHQVTGVHMTLYIMTDWLSIIPLLICVLFGVLGLFQLLKRKSLRKVDFDIYILGIYYMVVVFFYVIFECIPINYRPVLIEGVRETSYPSSTTLLVLAVMPALAEQINRRVKNIRVKKIILFGNISFSIFMVLGRTISGVHWLTDIIGGILLSAGLFCIYRGVVLFGDKKKN